MSAASKALRTLLPQQQMPAWVDEKRQLLTEHAPHAWRCTDSLPMGVIFTAPTNLQVHTLHRCRAPGPILGKQPEKR